MHHRWKIHLFRYFSCLTESRAFGLGSAEIRSFKPRNCSQTQAGCVADQAEVFWEQSNDLRQWKTIPGTSGSVKGGFGGGIETLRWTVTGNSDAQRYFRLHLQLR
ncbi:MAG: hypothetical protein RLZZ313_395 [Verrucomicrobiota bacterium]|jgi:hypothetical protein